MPNKKMVEMIVATAVPESEVQGQTDKIGEGRSTPEESGEVGGRSGYAYVICPTCSAINHVYIDDDVYVWYRCWNTARGRHYFRV